RLLGCGQVAVGVVDTAAAVRHAHCAVLIHGRGAVVVVGGGVDTALPQVLTAARGEHLAQGLSGGLPSHTQAREVLDLGLQVDVGAEPDAFGGQRLVDVCGVHRRRAGFEHG